MTVPSSPLVSPALNAAKPPPAISSRNTRILRRLGMPRPILAAFLLMAVTQTACAPYTWRTEVSAATREPLAEQAETTLKRDPQLPKLTGKVGMDRIDLQVQVADQCRDKTTTPVGEVVRTTRTLDDPVMSTFVAASVATAAFLAPDLAFWSCRAGNCGIDNGDAFDTWRTRSYLALGGIAVAYGVWAVLASHDSKAVTIVDKTETFSEWRTCPGKLPVGEAVTVVVRHKNGTRTSVGTAKLDAGGRATVSLRGAETAFSQNGEGEVVAMLDKITAELGCGTWGTCKQTQRCAAVRSKLPGYAEELERRFGGWRSAQSLRDGKDDVLPGFSGLLDRIDQMATVLAGGTPDCAETARQLVIAQWQFLFSKMRIDALAGLRIPALEQLARDARTGVRWAGVSDPYHEVAAQWLARLPADLAGYKAKVDSQCSKEASSLAALKKRGKWQDLLATVDVVYQKCERSQAATSIAAVRTWTVESGCSAVKSVESCLEACRLGGQSSCRILASAEELVALRDECAASALTTGRRLQAISEEHNANEAAKTDGSVAVYHFGPTVKRRDFDELMTESLDIVSASIQKCQPACARRVSGACELVSQMRKTHSDLVNARQAKEHEFWQMVKGLGQAVERQNAQQRKGGPAVCVARCQVEADDCMSRSTNFDNCRSNHRLCLNICR